MGDIDAGDTKRSLKPFDFDPHLAAQLGVEIRKRLVEQEHGGLAHDGAAHGDALALAAGKIARPPLEEGLDAEHACSFHHARLDLGLRRFPVAQAVGHVVVDRHVRIERVVLEHHGDVALGRLDVVDHAIADPNLARADGLDPSDHAQQRRFPAAGGPHEHAKGAVGHVETDALDGFDAAGIELANVFEIHACHRPLTSPSRPGRARTAAASGSRPRPAAAWRASPSP